jgi:predicted transcriptional regulator
MSKTVVATARVDLDLSDRLEKLAGILDRSRAWIISKAIERYVEEELALHAFIQVGEDAIDRGEYFTQEEMEEWVESLGRRNAA